MGSERSVGIKVLIHYESGLYVTILNSLPFFNPYLGASLQGFQNTS